MFFGFSSPVRHIPLIDYLPATIIWYTFAWEFSRFQIKICLHFTICDVGHVILLLNRFLSYVYITRVGTRCHINQFLIFLVNSLRSPKSLIVFICSKNRFSVMGKFSAIAKLLLTLAYFNVRFKFAIRYGMSGDMRLLIV